MKLHAVMKKPKSNLSADILMVEYGHGWIVKSQLIDDNPGNSRLISFDNDIYQDLDTAQTRFYEVVGTYAVLGCVVTHFKDGGEDL